MKWYNVYSKIIESYLRNRLQYVSLRNNQSHKNSRIGETLRGIPQGASLSSLLFIIIINDLPEHIKNSITFFFADDSQIVISGPLTSINILKAKLEEDLDNVINWMKNNKLELSIPKSLIMYCGRPSLLNQLDDFEIQMNGQTIQRVDSLKILGVMIDDKLNWTTQINNVSKKCNCMLSTLFPVRDIVSSHSRQILINAYVLSVLNYASIIWLKPSKSNYVNVKKILNRSARFIFRRRFNESVSEEINDKLKWLTPKYKYQFEVLKFAFSIINNCAPDYFNNYLIFNNFTTKQTRNHTYHVAIQDNYHTSVNTIKFNATQLWLDLPDLFQVNMIYPMFKKLLYEYLLSIQSAEYFITNNDNNICNYSCIESTAVSNSNYD